jgi:hypothetical protein
MADDEDTTQAAPLVDLTAGAVSSPHGGKHRRHTPATPAANGRKRTAQPKPTEDEGRLQESVDGAEVTAVSARRTRAK